MLRSTTPTGVPSRTSLVATHTPSKHRTEDLEPVFRKLGYLGACHRIGHRSRKDLLRPDTLAETYNRMIRR
jgi:hypothetical protein